ncbi:fatty acid desaturase, type 1 protein [Tanacetum coccineum]
MFHRATCRPGKVGESRSEEYSNVPELKEQWFYRFLHSTYIWHQAALAILLYLLGGYPYLVWGMGIRAVLTLHFSSLVNSVSHKWGERPWNTPDTSTNNWHGNRNVRGTDDEQSENPFGEDDDSSYDEQSGRRPKRNQREDNKRWESGMRVNIPDLAGDTLSPEGFIDWLVSVEEVSEFKEVPENKRVSLIATKLCSRASA